MNKSTIITIVIVLLLGALAFYIVNASKDVVKNTPNENTGTVAGNSTGGCFVGGCSGQICSDQPDVSSTCEFREEYACYAKARCERQLSGQCGWTETPEYQICINAIEYPGSDLK
jgi:hypothetical protein